MNCFSYPFYMSVPSVILQWPEVCTDKVAVCFVTFFLALVPHINWYFPAPALPPHSISSLHLMTNYAGIVFGRSLHFSLRGFYLLLLSTHNIAFFEGGVSVAIQARLKPVQAPVKKLVLVPPAEKLCTKSKRPAVNCSEIWASSEKKGLIFTIDS